MSQKQKPHNASTHNHAISSETGHNPVMVYLASLASKGGRIGQKLALDRMAVLLGYPNADSVDWSQITSKETSTLREKLMENFAPSTVNRYLGALKGVLKQTYLSGKMSEYNYRRAIKIKSVDDLAPEGRDLTHSEMSALMQACDDGTKVGARDVAIIALLYAAGLRPTELTALEMADYKNGNLIIKNGWDEERNISLNIGALDALQGWLAVRGNEPGPLFFAFITGDKMLIGKRIFSQALCGLLDRRAKTAGIDRLSPSDFRNAFINHLLDAGVDIVLVSRLAGMKDVRTIARYDRRGNEALQEAVKLLNVPYKQRDKSETFTGI